MQTDLEAAGWVEKVEGTRPNVESDAVVLEVREVRRELGELKALLLEGRGERGADER